MLGVCTIGAILIVLSSVIMYKQAKSERNDLEEKIVSIADIEKIYTDYQDSKSNLAILEEINGQTKNKSEELNMFLAELEQKTPKGCILSSMQYGEGVVTLQVTANNKTLCAKYIQLLKTFEQVGQVSTSGYTEEDSNIKDGPVNFTVVVTFQ